MKSKILYTYDTLKKKTSINKMRIRHTAITHQHLMKRVNAPTYIYCGIPLTIKHIITECRMYEKQKSKVEISHCLSTNVHQLKLMA